MSQPTYSEEKDRLKIIRDQLFKDFQHNADRSDAETREIRAKTAQAYVAASEFSIKTFGAQP